MSFWRTFFLAAIALFALGAAQPASADFRLEKTLAIAPGGLLDLQTDSGRVDVRGTDRTDVHVLVTSDRDDIEDRFEFRFEERGDGLEIRVRKRGTWMRHGFNRSESLQFEIEVPWHTNLELATSGGRISARDLDGAATVKTSGGRIEVQDITGDVYAATSGGSISAERIGGRADLDTSGGSITVEEVAENVRADTSGGSISIRGAGGRVDADTSGGSVTAYFEAGNGQGGSLSTSGGRITAYVDPDEALDIEASSSGGGVNVDIPIMVQGKISRSSIRGQLNGGGPTLSLHTSGGGVSVKSL